MTIRIFCAKLDQRGKNMFTPNELKRLENVEYISEIRASFLDTLYNVVTHFIADKSVFTIDNFSAIYYDEFTLNTNCHKDIFSTIYLEIDQPLNYRIIDKNIKKLRSKKKKDKIEFPELYLNMSDILDGLYNSFINNLDMNNLIWLDEYSINVKASVNDDDNQVHTFYFKIIPCLTYHNKNNVAGVIYKKNNGIEIEYPQLSIENYSKKRESTNGLYHDTILILKNILLQNKDIDSLPKEIIEIMLYNVPDDMFRDNSKSTIFNVINFIRNNSIKNFKTIDEQDLAFTSIYRSLSPYYVKHILKLIERYLIMN